MAVYFNGKEIKEIYYNGKKINEAYFNGKKVHKLWYYCYKLIAVNGTPAETDAYLYATRFYNYETEGKYGTPYVIDSPAFALASSSSNLKFSRNRAFVQNDEDSATVKAGASTVWNMTRYRPGDFYTPENYYGPYPEPDTQTT